MSKATVKYQVGDRVAERPKDSKFVGLTAETKARIAKYTTQRFGTVVGTKQKSTARGARTTYVQVLWDGMQTPSDHAQFRLCHEAELVAVQTSYMNART